MTKEELIASLRQLQTETLRADQKMLEALDLYDEACDLLHEVTKRWLIAYPDEAPRLWRIVVQLQARRRRRWHKFVIATRREI